MSKEKELEKKKPEEIFESPDEFAEFIKEKWEEKEEEARKKVESIIERRAKERAAKILEEESKDLRRETVA